MFLYSLLVLISGKNAQKNNIWWNSNQIFKIEKQNFPWFSWSSLIQRWKDIWRLFSKMIVYKNRYIFDILSNIIPCIYRTYNPYLSWIIMKKPDFINSHYHILIISIKTTYIITSIFNFKNSEIIFLTTNKTFAIDIYFIILLYGPWISQEILFTFHLLKRNNSTFLYISPGGIFLVNLNIE